MEALAKLKSISNILSADDSNDTSLDYIISQLYSDKNEMIYDINYLFNAYNNIGEFYMNDILERPLLLEIVCDEVIEFNEIYNNLKSTLGLTLRDTLILSFLNGLCILKDPTVADLDKISIAIAQGDIRMSRFEKLVEEIYPDTTYQSPLNSLVDDLQYIYNGCIDLLEFLSDNTVSTNRRRIQIHGDIVCDVLTNKKITTLTNVYSYLESKKDSPNIALPLDIGALEKLKKMCKQ